MYHYCPTLFYISQVQPPVPQASHHLREELWPRSAVVQAWHTVPQTRLVLVLQIHTGPVVQVQAPQKGHRLAVLALQISLNRTKELRTSCLLEQEHQMHQVLVPQRDSHPEVREQARQILY